MREIPNNSYQTSDALIFFTRTPNEARAEKALQMSA